MRFSKSLKICLSVLLLMVSSKFIYAESITLAWDAPSVAGVAGYNIYRSEQQGYYPGPPLNGGLLAAPSFTDSTAQRDRIYYYVVTAVSATGNESNYSNEVQAFVRAASGSGGGNMPIQFLQAGSSGLSVVDYEPNGSVLSEAVFPAAPLRRSGRIYVDGYGTVNTAVTLVNPNAERAALDFYFTDGQGATLYSGAAVLDPNTNLASFLDQPPFAPPAGIDLRNARTFTLSSSVPIAFTAARAFLDVSSQLLITSLPVSEVNVGSSYESVIPYYSDGGAGRSRVVLVNPVNGPVTGVLNYFSPDGVLNQNRTYTIPASSATDVPLPGQGWIQITPTGLTPTPAAVALLASDATAGAGSGFAGTVVPAGPEDSDFLIDAEVTGTAPQPGSVQTGFAITNPGRTPVTVHLQLFQANGEPFGADQVISVPAMGQTPVFLNQFSGLPAVAAPFKGFIRISGARIGLVELKKQYNERGELLFTAMPAIARSLLNTADQLFLPLIRDFGYTTSIIVFSSR